MNIEYSLKCRIMRQMRMVYGLIKCFLVIHMKFWYNASSKIDDPQAKSIFFEPSLIDRSCKPGLWWNEIYYRMLRKIIIRMIRARYLSQTAFWSDIWIIINYLSVVNLYSSMVIFSIRYFILIIWIRKAWLLFLTLVKV